MREKTIRIGKDWGHEIWMSNNKDKNYCGKILVFKPFSSCSLHYHEKKHETFYVLEGNLRVEFKKGYVDLREGDAYSIEPGKEHKIINLENHTSKLIEISTYHEDSDSFRIDE